MKKKQAETEFIDDDAAPADPPGTVDTADPYDSRPTDAIPAIGVLLEDGGELVCPVDHGERTFTHEGTTYVHVANAPSGRWVYRAV